MHVAMSLACLCVLWMAMADSFSKPQNTVVFGSTDSCAASLAPNASSTCTMRLNAIGSCSSVPAVGIVAKERPVRMLQLTAGNDSCCASPRFNRVIVARASTQSWTLSKLTWPERNPVRAVSVPRVLAMEVSLELSAVILLVVSNSVVQVQRADIDGLERFAVLQLPDVKAVLDGVSALDHDRSRLFFVATPWPLTSACHNRLMAVDVVRKQVVVDAPLSKCPPLSSLRWSSVDSRLLAVSASGLVVISTSGSVLPLPAPEFPVDTIGVRFGAEFSNRDQAFFSIMKSTEPVQAVVLYNHSTSQSSTTSSCHFLRFWHGESSRSLNPARLTPSLSCRCCTIAHGAAHSWVVAG